MDDHEVRLAKLASMVVKNQGTPMGLKIKRMYFQLLQTQLYGPNSSCGLFSENEILSMVHENGVLDPEFDSRIGVSI